MLPFHRLASERRPLRISQSIPIPRLPEPGRLPAQRHPRQNMEEAGPPEAPLLRQDAARHLLTSSNRDKSSLEANAANSALLEGLTHQSGCRRPRSFWLPLINHRLAPFNELSGSLRDFRTEAART